MAANVTGRYSRAHVKLGSAGKEGNPLWAKLGETIQRLVVYVGGQSIDPLIDLLRLTPHLKYLRIRDGIDDYVLSDISYETRTVDFKLAQLSELDFHCQFANLFCQICPNLQVLNQRYTAEPYEVDIMPLIRATHGTLQKLSLDNTFLSPEKFREICSFDRLHLKELSLSSGWQDPWTETESFMSLISKQPSLELLRLEPIRKGCSERLQHDCGPQIWSEIKDRLPNLKCLYLTIDASHHAALPTFLNNLPQLECLGIELINTWDKKNNFGAYCNPYLTSFKLKSVQLDPEDLSVFFAKTSNIRHLTLENVSDAELRAVSSLKQLESLEITCCDISQPDYVLSSVKILDFSYSQTTSIVDIVTVFPNVEHLTIPSGLTDDIVLVVVRELKRLKNLNLPDCCNMTVAVLDHIIEHGRVLEKLQIQLEVHKILPEKLTQLRKSVRVRVFDVPDHFYDNGDYIWSTGTPDSEEME